MPKLTINEIEVEVPEKATLLEAAQSVGIEIPTLCYATGKPPNTTCMVCVVEDLHRGRLLPACATRAEAGMVIATDSETVRQARRAALELLLSEHQGDCEAPCERACPAGLNIPLMLRLLARGEAAAAQALAQQALVLSAVLGRVCTAPCEAGCRRGSYDDPVAIRQLHGQLGETSGGDGGKPATAPVSGKTVVVIGAGPAGLAAAYALRGYGHACRVYEKDPAGGGVLRGYPETQLPRKVLEDELDRLDRSGVEFRYETEVGAAVSLAQLLQEADAVVLACNLLSAERTGVFYAKEQRMPVRSIASGKSAAKAAHAFLSAAVEQPGNGYQSTMGRLPREQLEAYVVGRTSPGALQRPRNPVQMREEAERCLHCDCHAPVSCKLRRFATEYGARARVFRNAERPAPGGLQRHGDVIFDAGKCIRCGLCVQITAERHEALGLAFAERGFTMHVAVPFGETLSKALTLCARECVEACPTGALAVESEEERSDNTPNCRHC